MMNRRMSLHKLIEPFVSPSGRDLLVSGLSLDSRQTQSGEVFIALRGHTVDGRDFIGDAFNRGACACITEPLDHHQAESIKSYALPVIEIERLHEQVSKISAMFYAYPGKQLGLVGITGTNGKTSIAYFVAQLLSSMGKSCGFMGTIGWGAWERLNESSLTTADPVSVQKSLGYFLGNHYVCCAMEVSSHGLEQCRVDGVDFDVAVFSNLSQDHLDYHGSMESYFLAKKKLFNLDSVRYVIVNIDDPYGFRLVQELKTTSKKIIAYSLGTPSGIDESIERVELMDTTKDGTQTHCLLQTPWGQVQLTVPLIGRYNLENVLASITAAYCLMDESLDKFCGPVLQLKPPPGRLEYQLLPNKAMAVVDYAHTPDALNQVLQVVKSQFHGPLTLVFGCGGDRDVEKRAKMGRIAEQWADKIILTNDNPRSENPACIINDILSGFNKVDKVTVLFERGRAIAEAVRTSRESGVVLIAGKGHERYQQLAEGNVEFNDMAEIIRCCQGCS